MVARRAPGAGELRHRCAFESPATVSDGAGGQSVTWTAALTVSGLIEAAGTPGETETAGAGTETLRAVLTVRDMSVTRAIAPAWRVTVDGRLWNVRGAYPFAPALGVRRFTVEAGVAT